MNVTTYTGWPQTMHTLSAFRSTAVAALLLATTACSNEPKVAAPTPPNAGIVAGTLQVTATNSVLTLRNTTEFIVGYMVIDKDQMVIALFPPCGAQCPTLVQGASTNVSYTNIGGYTPKSTEAIVMWWTYSRAADGTLLAQGSVQSKRITL